MHEEDGQTLLALGFLEKAPERAARILESHASELTAGLLKQLDADTVAAVLASMTPRHAADRLVKLGEDLAVRILCHLAAVDAAPMLRALDARARAALLRRLPSRQAMMLNWLLGYPDSSVGAWTDTRALTLSAELTAPEALAQVREADSPPMDMLYVLGRGSQLTGVISIMTLLRATYTESVASLCDKAPPPLQARAGLAGTISLRGWLLHNALPVIDRNRQFVGVLTRVALERGLMHSAQEEESSSLTDSLLEVTQAYWTGLSALWEASFSLLTAPLGRGGKARGDTA